MPSSTGFYLTTSSQSWHNLSEDTARCLLNAQFIRFTLVITIRGVQGQKQFVFMLWCSHDAPLIIVDANPKLMTLRGTFNKQQYGRIAH